MNLLRTATLIAVSCAGFSMAAPREAAACGGCFHGGSQGNTSVVTGHRMALSISSTQTVLWDQVQYAGDPEDFAWVLPVGPGAIVEESHDAWFESLEAVTSTRIQSEVVVCDGNGGGYQGGDSSAGCSAGLGSADEAGGGGGPGGPSRASQGNDGVDVLHEGTVGPYDTVTLKANDAQSLRTWLASHGYSIPADIDPVIDAYVAEHADFIALRLHPGQGVRQMTPVRVVTPGASPILPLRMVAAGTGANVSIVLYLIGEGRYTVQNFDEATLPFDELTWDWTNRSSNYAQLRDDALAGGGFLTTFSLARAFSAEIDKPDGTPASYTVSGSVPQKSLASLYFAQAHADDDAVSFSCPNISSDLVSGDKVAAPTEPCEYRGCSGFESSVFVCDGYTDLATALVGMHPRDVTVTRLEANLPRHLLATDLVLKASSTQSNVDNWLVAPKNLNEPTCESSPTFNDDGGDTSEGSAGGCAWSTHRSRLPNITLVGGLALAGLAAARRVAKRGRRR